MKIEGYIALGFILRKLQECGRDQLLREYGGQKVAPGITVADYLQMYDFYNKVGTFSDGPVVLSRARRVSAGTK